MVVRIFVGIPFLVSSAMIYYRPQSDIGVKTFALRNLPGSSMLKFERRDRLLALSEIRWRRWWRGLGWRWIRWRWCWGILIGIWSHLDVLILLQQKLLKLKTRRIKPDPAPSNNYPARCQTCKKTKYILCCCTCFDFEHTIDILHAWRFERECYLRAKDRRIHKRKREEWLKENYMEGN